MNVFMQYVYDCVCLCVYACKLTECLFYSLFQWVQDEYMNGGWTKHHAHMLEYEETNAENPKQSISVRVTEPADDEERNWKVTIISAVPVSFCLRFLFLSFLPLSSFCSCLCWHPLYVTV